MRESYNATIPSTAAREASPTEGRIAELHSILSRMEETASRLSAVADRFCGSRPMPPTEGTKAQPQAVANGKLEELAEITARIANVAGFIDGVSHRLNDAI